eukprot:387118_1
MTQNKAQQFLDNIPRKHKISTHYHFSTTTEALLYANELYNESFPESDADPVETYVFALKFITIIHSLKKMPIWNMNQHSSDINSLKKKSINIMKLLPTMKLKILSEYESKTEEVTNCMICLNAITETNKASISSCVHSFHFNCIRSWSYIENSCPICKQKFTHIKNISNNKILRTQDKKQKPAYEIDMGYIIYSDIVCSLCGSGDDEHLLLLCDGDECERGVHTYCMGLGYEIPQGQYFCESCTTNNESDENYIPSDEIDSDY